MIKVCGFAIFQLMIVLSRVPEILELVPKQINIGKDRQLDSMISKKPNS